MKKNIFQLAAAISFFTRIPVWRVLDIPAENYARIIGFWPLTGWITGGITAVSWLGFSMIFPPVIAIILAFVVRILLTGGFHEDGLGDFFDGFGGGRTQTDVLRIMKDSQVGSYALIGMIVYYLLLINSLLAIPHNLVFVVIFVADPLSKLFTALMINYLPYARTQSESKSKTLYDKLTLVKFVLAYFFGLVPLFLFLDQSLWFSAILPIGIVLFQFFYVKKRIGGYTGDICGATALLCELGFYLAVCLMIRNF